MKPKILIEVRGGVAEIIASTVQMDVYLFDWDNINSGDEFDGKPIKTTATKQEQFNKLLESEIFKASK